MCKNVCCICRCGGIGRHKGLKIPRNKIRTGSSPVIGIYVPLAQSVEHFPFKEGVRGSNLRWNIHSSIAQSVERFTVNEDATGSSPVGGANIFLSSLLY